MTESAGRILRIAAAMAARAFRTSPSGSGICSAMAEL